MVGYKLEHENVIKNPNPWYKCYDEQCSITCNEKDVDKGQLLIRIE